MKLKGAQVILQCLKEQGTDIIFGYPGGTVLPIYDALYSMQEITHIITAHEQGATHAADGYARSTGKVGVVIATSGPGATNTVTGIATACRDSVPLVVITGQVSQKLLRKDSFQEVDFVSITKSITKKNYLVTDPRDLATVISEAFAIAKSGRPGPVVIDVPKDVQEAFVDYEMNESEETALDNENNDVTWDEVSFNKAVELINNSTRPVIYAGGGVVISESHEELKHFAEKINSPVTCSLMGIGAFPGNHENYMGMIGMHGTHCSNYAANKCDLLIAVGARFSDRVISKVDTFAPNAQLIHIDIDPREIGKNINTTVPIVGDAKKVLTALIEKVAKKENNLWMQQIHKWKKHKCSIQEGKYSLNPKDIIEKLQDLTEGNCIITTEVGQHQIWTAQYFKFSKPRTLVTSGGLGTMGFGLGAAIGASFGNPGTKVINIAGDGSFKMNSTELATIAKYKVPIIQLILNNHTLGMVYQWQDLFYQGRFSHTKFGNEVDFVKLGEAYGIRTMRITENNEIESTLKKALSLNEPVIIECSIDSDTKVFPIVPPGAPITKYIG